VELTAGGRHEVRLTALEEPWRRKRGSSAERPWSYVGTDSGIREVAGLNFEGAQTKQRAADR